MHLLQLHEYLTLLNDGASMATIDDLLATACLEQAESIWPQLRLGSWTDQTRKVAFVARCHATGTLLVHVSADWKDCFLILVVPPRQTQAEAYLLFDIGAEYREIRLVCPALNLNQRADEDTIRDILPKLDGLRDPFAILEAGRGTYLQASADSGLFDVEHQLVSPSSHYGLETRASVETTINVFLSYAFGRKEWAREFRWRRMDL